MNASVEVLFSVDWYLKLKCIDLAHADNRTRYERKFRGFNMYIKETRHKIIMLTASLWISYALIWTFLPQLPSLLYFLYVPLIFFTQRPMATSLSFFDPTVNTVLYSGLQCPNLLKLLRYINHRSKPLYFLLLLSVLCFLVYFYLLFLLFVLSLSFKDVLSRDCGSTVVASSTFVDSCSLLTCYFTFWRGKED